ALARQEQAQTNKALRDCRGFPSSSGDYRIFPSMLKSLFSREPACRHGSCNLLRAVPPITTARANKVLQKDGFFRKRDEKRDDNFFRPAQPVSNTAPAANTAPEQTTKVEPKVDARREAKLVVGPDIKLKGVEISDCDT